MAGGQCLINNTKPKGHLQANAATILVHHQIEEMFNYPTAQDCSADSALQQEIYSIVQQSAIILADP
ncbi:MAG: hypothetical protein J6568_04500 [Snodgrassella sp.]|nr:hypothetical protein [Snodgrassella sp.]